MSNAILGSLPYLTLVSHIVLVVAVAAVVARRSWGRGIFSWLGRNSVFIAFLAALASIVGSLFYSEIIGYPPCTLCWWIRIFLYPLAAIFGIALYRKHDAKTAFSYALPLIIGGALVSLYYSYFSLGGESLLSCTAEGGGCDRLYVKEFGYITIPMMSLTLSAYLLLLAWVNKIFQNENSDARL